MKVLVAGVVLHVEERRRVLGPEGLTDAAVLVRGDDAVIRLTDGAAPHVHHSVVGPQVGEQLAWFVFGFGFELGSSVGRGLNWADM